MKESIRQDIESLWTSRRHGTVDAVSLVYEVLGDQVLRKIRVSSRGVELPVEYYSVKALLLDEENIRSMVYHLKDTRLGTLRDVFRVSDSDSGSEVVGVETLIISPAVKFDTTYYAFKNNAGYLCVVVQRPSGVLFYQRLVDPSMLSYVLSNQVGFLLVTERDGKYLTPDKQIEFTFVDDKLKIETDTSDE